MLEVNRLSHSFAGKVAVDDLSLSVDRGEIVGLVGRNGAGKTTTMRAIMGILDPDSGSIVWDGRPITRSDRITFGYMPEERGLYPNMTIRSQVKYFAHLHGLTGKELDTSVDRWISRLGLEEKQAAKLQTLSHGNQQRAQLAVSLVHNPVLTILDEPFSGLDPIAVDSMCELLVDQAQEGKGVLFSSHQLELVERICNRVVMVEEGVVRASGTLSQLKSTEAGQLRVQFAGSIDWEPILDGVQVSRRGPEGIYFKLASPDLAQAVLRQALEVGEIIHFGFEFATLAEIYRTMINS